MKAPAKEDNGSDDVSSFVEEEYDQDDPVQNTTHSISLVVNTTTTDASLVARKVKFYKEVDVRITVVQREHKTSRIIFDETFDEIFKLMMSFKTA